MLEPTAPTVSGRRRCLARVSILVVCLAFGAGPTWAETPTHRVLDPVSEDARTRRIEVFTASAPVTSPESTRRAVLAPDSTAVSGRLVFRDRLYDIDGYTGTLQVLPARGVGLELRAVPTDSVVAVGWTDDDGRFDLRCAAPGGLGNLVLRGRTRTSGGAEIPGVDSSGTPLTMVLASDLDVEGGIETAFEPLVADDGFGATAGAVAHVLDLSRSAVEWVERDFGPWPGAMPSVRYDVQALDSETGLTEGGDIVVSSPAAGRDDVWSDGRILAGWGAALVRQWSGTGSDRLDFDDVLLSPKQAFGIAASWSFAAAVQAERAVRRLDVDGGPLALDPDLLVDLPAAPPPGIPIPAESVLDIEAGLVGFDARPVLPRGQRAAPVLATLLHETADPSDDDPVDGSRADFLSTLAVAATLTGATYEDFHDAWVADFGDPGNVFTSSVRDRAGVAIEIDSFEPDDTIASDVLPWVQPPPDSSGGVVVTEIDVGAVDGIELTNTGPLPVDLSGWRLRARRQGFGLRSTTLPAGSWLASGRSVLVLEGTPDTARSPFDLPAADWDVPWAAGTDGSVTVLDAAFRAVDFVRWGGSTDAPPSGTGFAGSLAAPTDERLVLARDAAGTDTDSAADFALATPTPGWPNVEPRVHTLRPRGDVDRMRVIATGLTEVHARRVRDEGIPRLGVSGVAGPTGPGIGRDAAGSAVALIDTSIVTLDTEGTAATSTGLHVFAWRPSTPLGLFPVEDLRAELAGSGAFADTVRLSWDVVAAPESLHVRENGTVIATLGPDARGLELARSIGTYTYEVEPLVGGIAGPPRLTRVFLGPAFCSLDLDFQSGAGSLQPDGGFVVDDTVSEALDGAVLRDAPVAGPAIASFSTSLLIDPGTSVLLEHAIHFGAGADTAIVDLTVDDGLHWIEVARWDGSERAEGPGGADWTDGNLVSEDFVADTVDLSSFAGRRARVRLRRVGDGALNAIGWTVDRLAIRSARGTGPILVDPSGSDDVGCGTGARPYATIAFGVEQAAVGDTVLLAPGDHVLTATGEDDARAGVQLPAGVTLLGAGVDVVRVIVPASEVGVRAVDSIGVPDDVAQLRGLTIVGGTTAVFADGVRTRLASVRLESVGTGFVARSTTATLDEVTITGSAVGVLSNDSRLDVTRSTFADLDNGILLVGATDSITVAQSGFARCASSAARSFASDSVVSLDCVGTWEIGAGFLVPDVELLTPVLEADPLHCNPTLGDLTLASDSPWAGVAGCGRIGSLDVGCERTATDAPIRSQALNLEPARPNPFNPRTEIAFDLPRSGPVRLEVFDIRGRRVVTLVDGVRDAGRHAVVWTGTDSRGHAVASGVYLLRIQAGETSRTRRVALVR